jgi:hypothetical protein
MVSPASLKSQIFCLPAAISMLAFGQVPVLSQDGAGSPAFTAVKEIPDRFFQVQDASGFFWQAVGTGALTSGETQYLQSGLNLLVEGDAFAPAEAKVLEPGQTRAGQLILSEKRETVSIRRLLYFDRERSAVRLLDEITNTSGRELVLSVQLRTTFPFGWQSLHGQEGGLLSMDPVLKFGEEDQGLVIHFSAAEGRHDTLILCGNGGEVSPKLTASANRRELTLGYSLTIPAGGSRSLLHWISQVTLPELGDAGERFASFFQAGRLLDPGIDDEALTGVMNFPKEALPPGDATAAKAGSLLALNEFLDEVGVHRRATDLLWLSPGSQVSGSVSEKGMFTVPSPAGEPTVIAMKDVAAVRGGARSGMPTRIFLRDGTVLPAPVSVQDFTFQSTDDEEAQTLEIDSLRLLLLKAEASDGTVPSGTLGYVQWLDRSVSALQDGDLILAAVAPWGEMELQLSDIEEISYVTGPAPAHRVIRSDGSRYSVFLKHRNFSTKMAREGEVERNAGEIVRYWRAGRESTAAMSGEETWLDFSEIPDEFEFGEGFLIRGNNLLAGTFKDSAITIESPGTSIRVETSRVRSVRRNPDVTTADSIRYVVELKNGESIEGGILEDYLNLFHNGGEIRIPTSTLYAFRSL